MEKKGKILSGTLRKYIGTKVNYKCEVRVGKGHLKDISCLKSIVISGN